MDPSELQANKQRKTQNHPAKTVREIKGQDLWQQGKLSCTTGRNAFIKEDKPPEVQSPITWSSSCYPRQWKGFFNLHLKNFILKTKTLFS